ncbi:hypothetical protein [Salinicola rhizosphaerae]|uniref:Uncharacterized protein n=1 Tax=Salinicola rhizosphaerae TaxID=1443141 RepID=A0ABQ3E969_9GAMM|nr:hypothetical protein [Salinicola rhizosphaerae]GHB30702.1 hypothetical protein GCM10009038_31870 [Salinicola rhizosphaerae]
MSAYDYRPLVYCPTCWPCDEGERNGDQCARCGETVLVASASEAVDLLQEQIGALRKMCLEKQGRSHESMAADLVTELGEVLAEAMQQSRTEAWSASDKGQVH